MYGGKDAKRQRLERLAALVRPCLPHLDYLIVNDVEMGAIAGIATLRDGTTDVAACIRAARAITSRPIWRPGENSCTPPPG